MAFTCKRSGSEKRKRNSPVGFRASDAELAEIVAQAGRVGLTVSSYVRSRALEKPTTRAVRRPPVETAQLAQLLGMLGALGGSLQLMAKNRGGVTETRLQDMMEEFRKAAEVIIHALGKHPHLSQEVHHRGDKHDH